MYLKILIFLLTILLLANPSIAELKKVTYLPHWIPQAQFAGYYVAYKKGIYKKYGLDVNIIQGSTNCDSSDMLAKKKTDFATMWLTTGIKSRSHGIKMINVAQISQYSALILVAKKSHGIYKPEDLNGKKISLWGGDFLLQPNAFFKKYNLKVTVIPQLDNINLFLQDGVDAAAAMWFNEVHTLYAVGYDPDQITTFFFSKYGLNFPEDGMYVLEETYKKDPEMVRNFIKASFEGWLYAFQHKDEALDILLEYIRKANIPVNRMHEKWMLEKMQDWILPHDQETQLGYLRPKDFKLVSETLKENKLIETIPKYNEFFIDCYNEKK